MEITTSDLIKKIENGDKVVINFKASWCGPCSLMKPTFESVSELYNNETSDVRLYMVDVEESRDFAISLGIRSVPTIKTFNNGVEVSSTTGLLREDQIKNIVNDLIHG
jgi:thioredoxin 1